MKIGMKLIYTGSTFRESAEHITELEHAGLDAVSVPEAYSFDAVSQLGFLSARTTRLALESGIVQTYTRTPSLTAMTAVGLDYVSDGRFTLGIGASGPQVVEGFHGVRYDAPLGRTREIVDICRQVWRREKLTHHGRYYQVPLPAEQGTGLGKPLKLINHPVREQIPIQLAAIGPKNVALAAEIAEVWEPIFFHPGKADAVWGQALRDGRARRDPALNELQTSVGVPFAIGPGAHASLVSVRHQLALYLGGMGPKNRNFYAQLAERYGYSEQTQQIQHLYLAGRKDNAAATVPDELAHAVSLIGSEQEIAAKLKEFAAAGVTQLNLQPLNTDPQTLRTSVENLKSLT